MPTEFIGELANLNAYLVRIGRTALRYNQPCATRRVKRRMLARQYFV